MKKLVLALFAAAFSTAVSAAEIKPAIIYDLGGKFDKSFNEAAFHGAEKFKKETGVAYREFEMQNASQREQALRRFAERRLQPDRHGRLLAGGRRWRPSPPNFPTPTS